MLNRSEISFIFLWVINPILLLFFQNCSHIPETKSDAQSLATIEATDNRAPACTGVGHRCTQPF